MQDARQMDIASGYFEIGALLALDGKWQHLEQLRLLVGDEVSRRTQAAFEAALAQAKTTLNASLEAAKEQDDFLAGVPAIVDALHAGRMTARLYRPRKFHAKAYISYPRDPAAAPHALVGSSNFTEPGLSQNVELNVRLDEPAQVAALQAWYEQHWAEGEEVTDELLKVVERHTKSYSPFEVYLRAMAAYFYRHEESATEWERTKSRIYRELSHYQREGYHALMQIASRYNGALLCDGVGLGKTFIGLMVIERLLWERKRVALIVPKTARKAVWEAKLAQYLPDVRGHFSNLVIYNQTDLTRQGEFPERMQEVADKVDAIIIDEAHHFRTIDSGRSKKLFQMTAGKQVFLLTATPVNNSLYDLMHLIEYFSRGEPSYFSAAPLGIHTLRGHFRKLEEALQIVSAERLGQRTADGEAPLDPVAAERLLQSDPLVRTLVVQRSRAYVRRSLQAESGREVAFPTRHPPRVAAYSLKKTYGKVLAMVEQVFDRVEPLLTLPMYYPLAYLRHPNQEQVDSFAEGRQKQIAGLIRTLLLKRFESSAVAFRSTCDVLFLRLLNFIAQYDAHTFERQQRAHKDLLADVLARHPDVEMDEPTDEDDLPAEMDMDEAGRLDPARYNIGAMILDAVQDVAELARILRALDDFSPERDDKVQALIGLMQTDPLLARQKVLIFTEYRDTARYLADQMGAAGIGRLRAVDGSGRNGLGQAIRAFAPYYNGSSSPELAADGVDEARVLVATDVLAEGLNLQDAACIINYDLHWNPVRLMQRIGRVDRRLDPATEARLVAEHPHAAPVRGNAYLWNFLPPEELNRILSLYERVSHKTLRISKVFGIEGRQLLTPEDDYDALREFNEAYEGATTSHEEIALEYQRLLREYPDLPMLAEALPYRLFSGKAHPDGAIGQGARAVFFCYRLPAKDPQTGEWTTDGEQSFTQWYLYHLATGDIEDDASRIFATLQTAPDTPRQVVSPLSSLSDLRRKMDRHITNTYLRKVQAPAEVHFTLLAWMEIN